jgi:hypothetical protein
VMPAAHRGGRAKAGGAGWRKLGGTMRRPGRGGDGENRTGGGGGSSKFRSGVLDRIVGAWGDLGHRVGNRTFIG